jgi:uncharacterized protein YutE (UPF0331/DUF86 family)
VSENRLWRLADELTAELNEFLNIKAEVADAQSRLGTREPDTFELRALGSILHDIYNGAESICRHIATEIDRRLPTGANWHRDLLNQMTKQILKTRPSVIQSETASLLENYRSFRHVARHVYGFKLDWVQMKPLLDNALTTIEAFTTDVERFIAFLRLMTSDSESDAGK